MAARETLSTWLFGWLDDFQPPWLKKKSLKYGTGRSTRRKEGQSDHICSSCLGLMDRI